MDVLYKDFDVFKGSFFSFMNEEDLFEFDSDLLGWVMFWLDYDNIDEVVFVWFDDYCFL